MIEYIHDVIKATAGEPFTISAKITTEAGELVSDLCCLRLLDDEGMIAEVEGTLSGEVWSFEVPAAKTEGLFGRYWYCFCDGEKPLCFKEPIYLV